MTLAFGMLKNIFLLHIMTLAFSVLNNIFLPFAYLNTKLSFQVSQCAMLNIIT